MEPTNNNIPQFETPHSGSANNRMKLSVIALIILSALMFNLWYYFNFFKTSPVAEAPEVLLPPTEEEKTLITEDLSARKADVSDDDKEAMINSLSAGFEIEVTTEDREESSKSLY